MIRKLPFLFILLVYFFNSQAQQIYECKDFGFKFVIVHTSERDSFYTVPLITYIKSGSPADMAGMVAGAEMLWIAGEAKAGNSKNLTGLEFLNQINSRQYDCCMILYTTMGWQQRGELYASLISYTAEFPKANKAPVEGGPKLLGTCVGNCKGDIKTILYENGDVYTGPVVNKVYPDPDATGGKYVSFAESEKIKTDAEAIYKNALAEKKKEEDLKKQIAQQKADEEAAALKKYQDEQAAIALKEYRQDSVINVKSLKEILNNIDPANFTNQLVCGIGMDINHVGEYWFVSEIEKYGPAWLAGIKIGDRLTSVALNEQYIYNMNKLEIFQKLTGNLNALVSFTYVRPSEGGNEMRADLHCFKIYNLPASFASGGCLSGDCQNGKGVFQDAKGNIYDGVFSNGKLNDVGSITMPHDSMVIYSVFKNGLKNGFTTVYSGVGQLHRSYDNYLQNAVITFTCNFTNDLPDGYGTISYNYEAHYSVRYINGTVQGKALRIYTDNSYIYCDPTPRYTLTNCLQYDGKPTDVSMVEPPANNNNSNNNNYQEPDPNLNQTTYERPTIASDLGATLRSIESLTPGYSWTDGGTLVFTYEAVYDQEYLRFSVPPGKKIQINILMENADVGKVKFLPREMSYMYEPNLTGGPLFSMGQVIDGNFFWQVYSISNNYEKTGDILIEIRALPADKYFRRTIAYSWGISN